MDNEYFWNFECLILDLFLLESIGGEINWFNIDNINGLVEGFFKWFNVFIGDIFMESNNNLLLLGDFIWWDLGVLIFIGGYFGNWDFVFFGD